MYKLAYTKEAKSQIDKLSGAVRIQIKEAIEKIASDPSIGKRLTHELSDFMSHRSGDYRIIYQIHNQEVMVLIVSIGHRKDVYEKLSRRFR